MRTALALFVGALLMVTAGNALGAQLATASTLQIGVQDQGADPAALAGVAHDLGARTVRVVASPTQPQTQLIAQYRAQGFQVQAAIIVKRQTTVSDIRRIIRGWHGMVRTVTVGNEPDLNGITAGTYARLWCSSARMIRREFPGTVVGLGDYSPAMGEYAVTVAKRLQGCKTRPAFVAWHPYQFLSDPLAAPTERSGVGSWVGLGNLATWTRKLKQAGLKAPARCTEFSYLVDGRYQTSRAAWLWPRAIQRASKVCAQLVIYGLGAVPKGTWGSAALLDAGGHRTAAFVALARALGRVLSVEHPILPTGLLPDGTGPDRVPPLPLTTSTASGASSDTQASVDDDPDDPSAPVVQDPDDDEGNGAPAVCELDDVTDEQWAANGCDAFYPDDDAGPVDDTTGGDDDVE